jgi:uncharacterized membrane protein
MSEPSREQRLAALERAVGEFDVAHASALEELRNRIDSLRHELVSGAESTAFAVDTAPVGPESVAVRCASCTAEWPAGTRFCQACGRDLAPSPAVVPSVAAGALTCSFCASSWPVDTRFCKSCGRPLLAPPEPVVAAALPVQTPPPSRPATPSPSRLAPASASRTSAPSSREPAVPSVPLRDRLPEMTLTMLLAWVGGIVTVAGLTFLFVLAASRGWITPGMRLGIGTALSTGLLGASLRMHRRHGKLDAALACAGVGIAGLYTTLAAATLVYNDLSRAQALAGAGVIAFVAIGAALVIDAEAVALFGVGIAMIAPAVVVGEITSVGLLFTAVMAAAAIPLRYARGWWLLPASTVLLGAPQAAGLIVESHGHAGGWMVAPVMLAIVWMCLMYQQALTHRAPRALNGPTAAYASVSFATALATSYAAGPATTFGSPLRGWLMLVVAAAFAISAALPVLLGRPHADLTDLLGAYALTACAAGGGVLLHGPVLVSGWAVEGAALAIVAARVATRGPSGELGISLRERGVRLYVAASAYLVLALLATPRSSPPAAAFTIERWGAHQGLLGLALLALSLGAWSFVALRSSYPWRRWSVAAPITVLAYAAMFLVSGQAVVVGWCLLAVACAAAVFTPRMRALVGETVAVTAAASLTSLAALVTLHAFARPAVAATIAQWGSYDGLVSLAAILVATGTATAAVLATDYPWRRWSVAAPITVLAYAAMFLVSGDAVIVAWSAIAASVALTVRSRRLRRMFGAVEPITVASTLLLGAVAVAGHYDHLPWQLVHHGALDGTFAALCLTAAAIVTATGIRDLEQRSLALLPAVVLGCVTLATALPGAWAVASWAIIPLATAIAARFRSEAFARHLDLRTCLESAVWLTGLLVAIDVAVYATPARIFIANASPARGLSALIATVAAAWALARVVPGVTGRIRPLDAPSQWLAAAAATLSLWTVTSAILGLAELRATGAGNHLIADHFDQGQVMVSVAWGISGLALLYAGLRRDSRQLRTAGVILLFLTPVKLVAFDLAFLPATSRAASFIATGLALIVAALVVQRLAPLDEPRPVS